MRDDFEPPFRKTTIAAVLAGISAVVLAHTVPHANPCAVRDAAAASCAKNDDGHTDARMPPEIHQEHPTSSGDVTIQLDARGTAIASAQGHLEPGHSVPLQGVIANVEPVPHTV